jgi:NTP pyrophosphatase (non-canonical NTP hydrolase)
MTLDEYQKATEATAIYLKPVAEQLGADRAFLYTTLGLVGEAGEVADKVKKVIRDGGGVISDSVRDDLAKELGDVLWYLARVAADVGLSLNEVASRNLEKLQSRQQRGSLQGSGDER